MHHSIRQALTSVTTLALAVGGVVLAIPSMAQAIPAFARRYETTCQTCHTAYPQLNPFGEAFRRNGYRYPEGKDDELSMDEPVQMGHDVHKRMFPDETWPGELPGDIPVAFVLGTSAAVSEGPPAHHHGAQPAVGGMDMGDADAEWGVAFKGAELALVSGGVFGDHFSWFGKVEINHEGEVHLERPFVVVAPFDGPYMLLKAGMFSPSLYPFSIHRSLTGHNLAFTTVKLGDNAWTPEPQQIGLEANGVLFHRLGWAAGVVEGAGNEFNRAKDVYGRLEYKLEGLPLDGTGESGYTRAYREWSLALGTSFYRGFATFDDPTGTIQGEQSDAFWRASVDMKAHVHDLALTVAAYRQEHQRPVFANREQGRLDAVLAEASYVVFPWFVPLVRYEVFREELPTDPFDREGHRLLLGANALLRANINLRLLAGGRMDEGRDPELEEVSLAIQAGF